MTLIEVMVALGIGAIFLVGLMTVMSNLSKQSIAAKESMENEAERYAAESSIRQVVSHALDVRLSNLPNLNAYAGTAQGSGAIVAYDSDLLFGGLDPIQAIAAFWRETTMSGLPVPVIQPIRRTGLFFQLPTASRYGALYISLNGVSPSRDQMFFANLVRLQINNIQTFAVPGGPPTPVGRPVTAFDLTLTYRKFLGPLGGRRAFCPAPLMGAAPCLIDGTFKDEARTIRIVLRNNVLARSITGPPAPVGSPRWTRVFDGVYFFQPQFQGGLQ